MSDTPAMTYPEEFAYAVGRAIYFRYLTEDDARGDWHLWFNSPEVTANMIMQRWVNTPEDQLDYLAGLRRSRERLALAVVDRASHRFIGIGSLSKIDTINRKAEMSVVIGPADCRDGVRGLEALSLLTEIGLVRLNLNKIIATSMENSEAGIRMTKLLGYTETGRFREHGFIDGRYVDCIIMEMLQREWLDAPRRPKSIRWAPAE